MFTIKTTYLENTIIESNSTHLAEPSEQEAAGVAFEDLWPLGLHKFPAHIPTFHRARHTRDHERAVLAPHLVLGNRNN